MQFFILPVFDIGPFTILIITQTDFWQGKGIQKQIKNKNF